MGGPNDQASDTYGEGVARGNNVSDVTKNLPREENKNTNKNPTNSKTNKLGKLKISTANVNSLKKR